MGRVIPLKYAVLKRGMDWLLSICLLLLLSPIFLGVALLIRVIDGSPVFFSQKRLGVNGRPFSVYKFRTFPKSKGNAVPTALGVRLRTRGVDELPQLINIMLGQMSFIGPRPLPVEYKERMSVRQLERLVVRPGLSGLAQVLGRNRLGWLARFRYDLLYAELQGPVFDIRIFLASLKIFFAPAEQDRLSSLAGQEFRPGSLG